MKLKKIFFLAVSTTVFLWAMEKSMAENLSFINIRVGGTGCPGDITQIVTSPDQSTASLIFQSFESHVPLITPNPKASPFISILNCNVFLDVKLPANTRLDALEVSYDMRGHTFLETGVIGQFKSFLMSSNGMGTERAQRAQLITEKSWMNSGMDQDEDFIISAGKALELNSNCGQGSRTDVVSIHLQHQLMTQILRPELSNGREGTITMDTSDLKGGIKIRARTSSCPGGGNPGRGNGRNCRVERINGRAVMTCI